MNIEGSYTFDANFAMVWTFLHDASVLNKSIPGCERLDQVSQDQFDVTMSVNAGPFTGQYVGAIKLTDVVGFESMTILVEGTGPEGPLRAEGNLTLTPTGESQTKVGYLGDIVVNGRLPAQSPRLLHTTANALIRKFMESFARQLQIQSGVYTTRSGSASFLGTTEPAHRTKGSRTIDTHDKLSEIKRNRRALLIILVALLLGMLVFIGFVALIWLIFQWVSRFFKQSMTDNASQTHSELDSAFTQ